MFSGTAGPAPRATQKDACPTAVPPGGWHRVLTGLHERSSGFGRFRERRRAAAALAGLAPVLRDPPRIGASAMPIRARVEHPARRADRAFAPFSQAARGERDPGFYAEVRLRPDPLCDPVRRGVPASLTKTARQGGCGRAGISAPAPPLNSLQPMPLRLPHHLRPYTWAGIGIDVSRGHGGPSPRSQGGLALPSYPSTPAALEAQPQSGYHGAQNGGRAPAAPVPVPAYAGANPRGRRDLRCRQVGVSGRPIPH